MKTVRRFRENFRAATKKGSRAEKSSAEEAPTTETDLEVENILFLVEHTRHIIDAGGTFEQIIPYVKSVIEADVLILQDSLACAIVRYSDFALPDETVHRFCLHNGLYHRLAGIRFIHLFERDSQMLGRLRSEGQKFEALVAVPLIRNDRPFGCLAAGFRRPIQFTSRNVMLQAVAAEIISMADGFIPRSEK